MFPNTDAFAFIGRLLMAVMFLMSGFGTVVAPGATMAWMASVGLPIPAVGYGIAIVIELGGGLLLILGLQTRILGAVLSLFAIATALIFHRNLADPNQLFQFLKNIAVTGACSNSSLLVPATLVWTRADPDRRFPKTLLTRWQETPGVACHAGYEHVSGRTPCR